MNRYTIDDLEILIATMNRGDLSFLERIFSKPISEITENIIIVNQGTVVLDSEYSNIQVINDAQLGLSRSRNIAIQNASKPLCWILDDDVQLLPGAIESVIESHNTNNTAIITFKTRSDDNEPYYTLGDVSKQHDRKSIRKVLSPEITFKHKEIINKLSYDERFGLGSTFEDSENYIFLKEALDKGVSLMSDPKFVVKHPKTTSSDMVVTDRVIKARGALAAFDNRPVKLMALKYMFFLLRKGYVVNLPVLLKKYQVFVQGAHAYLKSSK
ncbi:glycosyltransferase [Nonlabens tegetincola]|uniref:glycosyltransferase family 2 protein n=1 Tax=Nonlabens tegetincola TaxID=323273 RepID=UPI0030C7DEAB